MTTQATTKREAPRQVVFDCPSCRGKGCDRCHQLGIWIPIPRPTALLGRGRPPMNTPDPKDLDLLDDESLGLDFLDQGDVETTRTITPRMIRADLKREAITMMKQEHLRDIMPQKPAPGTAYHLISNGKYDFWTWIPVLLGHLGYADEFYGSTWTLNRQACQELLQLFDQGKIRKIGFLTGLYFKRRETAVYAQLVTGLTERKQRYLCLENHAKVTLLMNRETRDYLVVEGSANYTANPRIEQYVILNDRTVYEHHRAWIEEALEG